MRHGTSTQTEIFSRLATLHMSESERQLVNAYIHEGESIAELMSGAAESVRAGLEFAERGIKSIFPGHLKH